MFTFRMNKNKLLVGGKNMDYIKIGKFIACVRKEKNMTHRPNTICLFCSQHHYNGKCVIVLRENQWYTTLEIGFTESEDLPDGT